MDEDKIPFPKDPKQVQHLASELGLLQAGLGAWRKRPDGVEEFITSRRLGDEESSYAMTFMERRGYTALWKGYEGERWNAHDTPFIWWVKKSGKKNAYLAYSSPRHFLFLKFLFKVLLEADWARVAFDGDEPSVEEEMSYGLSDIQQKALSYVTALEFRSYK